VSDTAGAARGSLPAGSTAGSIGGGHRGEPSSSLLSPGGSSLQSGGSETADGSDIDDHNEDNYSDGNDGSALASPQTSAAPAGMDVPEGFQFTGDLEADLERLDALQQQEAGSFTLLSYA
jgi:hypothetical protein